MGIATGRDRPAMLRGALAALGGIERFIKRGDRVMVKVNAAFATPAMIGATTKLKRAATRSAAMRAPTAITGQDLCDWGP